MIALPTHPIRVMLQMGMCTKCKSPLPSSFLLGYIILVRRTCTFLQFEFMPFYGLLNLFNCVLVKNCACYWLVIRLNYGFLGFLHEYLVHLILHLMHFISYELFHRSQVIYLLLVLAIGIFFNLYYILLL